MPTFMIAVLPGRKDALRHPSAVAADKIMLNYRETNC
jgi:hypothetical protein